MWSEPMRMGITVWIMVIVLSGAAGAAFALEPAGASPTAPSERGGTPSGVQGTGKASPLTGCRMRLYREDLMQAPFQLLVERPIPGPAAGRPLTPSEAKFVEKLPKAAKKTRAGGKP